MAGAYAESCAAWSCGDTQRVLVAFERSGRVRDWLRVLGVEAWSCDLRPCDQGGPHLQGDVFSYLDDGWDAVIAHPPCTYLSRCNVRYRRDHPELEVAALRVVERLWLSPTSRLVVENPVGAVWGLLGRPKQQIEPWMFGDPYTKRTCLWMRGISTLRPAVSQAPVDCRSWCDVKSGSRGRSITFPGIAQALAAAVVDSLRDAGVE